MVYVTVHMFYHLKQTESLPYNIVSLFWQAYGLQTDIKAALYSKKLSYRHLKGHWSLIFEF